MKVIFFFFLWKLLIVFCFKIGVFMFEVSLENVRKVSVFLNYVVKFIIFCKIRMVVIFFFFKNFRLYVVVYNYEKWDILKICL